MKLKRWRDRIDRVLEICLVTLMAVNVINVLWQVFTRFVLRDPSSFTEELARYLLIWVGLLGAGYASGKKMHLAIAVLLEGLKGRVRHIFELAIQALIFGFALLVLAWGGLRLVLITLALNQMSAALRIPLGYVYLVLPLCGFLIMFYALVEAADKIKNLRKA